MTRADGTATVAAVGCSHGHDTGTASHAVERRAIARGDSGDLSSMVAISRSEGARQACTRVRIRRETVRAGGDAGVVVTSLRDDLTGEEWMGLVHARIDDRDDLATAVPACGPRVCCLDERPALRQ